MKGEILGIMSSLMAASMVIAPVVAGALFEIKSVLPFVLGIVLMGFSAILEHRSLRRAAGKKGPELRN